MPRTRLTTMMLCLLLASAAFAQSAGKPVNLLTNGSFEFWSQYGQERIGDFDKFGPKVGGQPALLPVRWLWSQSRPATISRSTDAHSGKYALSVRCEKGSQGASFDLGYLEAVPEATYTFGVWAKGSGNIEVSVTGKAPEGEQVLKLAKGQAGKRWQEITGTVEIPGHIRLVTLRVKVASDVADVLLDDAYIAAPLDSPCDADAILRDKQTKDSHTLFFADFDSDKGPVVRFNDKAHDGKCSYTDDKTGRFGRALRVAQPDMATIVFAPKEMPKEGTIELWVSPDEVPLLGKGGGGANAIQHYLEVHSPSHSLAVLNCATNNCMNFTWRITDGEYDRSNGVSASSWISLARMRKGQWTHVAATWDASAVRLYVDGVLADMQTEGPLPWFAVPSNLTIGSVYSNYNWDGMVDEIRISDIQRYGPITPKGATPKPLPPAAAPVKATPVAAEKPKLDMAALAAQRDKLIGKIEPTTSGEFESKLAPDPSTGSGQGERYIYEVASAKSLIRDSAFPAELEKDKIVPGLTTMKVNGEDLGWGSPESSGLCWKLGEVKPGKYYVGVLFESQAREGPPIEGWWDAHRGIFLNGRNVQCSTLSNPVQAAPGVWFAEIQAAATANLKPGDVIAFAGRSFRGQRVARLVLHTREPARGPFKIGTNFGGNIFSLYTNLMLMSNAYFTNSRDGFLQSTTPWVDLEQNIDSVANLKHNAAGKAVATCQILNPLPIELTVDYVCTVRGYYRKVLGQDKQQLTIPAQTCITREIPFDPTADDPAYSVEATVKAVKSGQTEIRGPQSAMPLLGWPEADMVEFFPFLRQSVPWVNPFEYRNLRRLVLTSPIAGPRPHRVLNGQWELGLTTSLQPPMPVPADIKFKKMNVPLNCPIDKTEPRAHGAYVRRTVELPADAVGKTWRLTVTKVVDEATAYVNGVKVGNVRGGGTPLVADATGAIKPGTNEIVLVVRDILAIMDQDYVNKANPIPSVSYLDAPGIGGSWTLAVGTVRLDASPSLAASELVVITSVRKKKLSARLNVTNHLDHPVHASVKATLLDAGKPVFELGREELNLAKGQSAPLKFQKDWADAKLWDPDSPSLRTPAGAQLYVVSVEVTDLDTHTVTDLACERFGFRESWIEGNHIFLNGVPVKLKGGWLPGAAGSDVNLNRGAPVPDWFDEWGTMCDQDLADVTNSSSKHNVEREVFWEYARKNCLAAAKELQNHPSIIAWDLSNEWLSFLGYSGGDGLLGARQLESMTKVLAEQDPTRWTFYDGDCDLCGLHYNFASHYMMEGCNGSPTCDFGHDAYNTQARHSLPPRADNAAKMMVSSYQPDCSFWRSLDQDFKVGDIPPTMTTFKYGSKVLMNTENLWKVNAYMPPGPSKVIGEDDVVSDAYDSGSGPAVWLWKQNLDAHRDLGTSYIGPYGRIPGVLRRAYATQCFIMPDTLHHGFGGRKFSRRYDVLNDLLHPAKMALKWSLLDSTGKAVAGELSGKIDYDMASGDLRRDEFSFTLPKVDARTKFTLDLRLEDSGVLVYGEQQDIEVWPDVRVPMTMPTAQAAQRHCLLLDPKGKTAEVLTKAGLEFTKIDSLALEQTKVTNTEKMLIIIGEDALTADNAGSVALLSGFVSTGGRVLILAQTVTPGGLPANAKLEPREWESQIFVRVPTHPILEGVTSMDLHFWAPDRVIVRGSYTKPEGGPATPLLDSGTNIGLEWTQLMELYRGKGLYLLCQLPMAALYDDEPMAREMLARVVGYAAAGGPFRQPTGQFKVVSSPESPVIKALENAGIANEVIQPAAKVDASSTILLDASSLQSASRNPQSASVAGWAQALADGATVVVSSATPQDAAWLGKLSGTEVRFTSAPYLMWQGRGYRTGMDAPVAGLSQVDLYYKRYAGNEGATGQACDATLAIEPFQDWAVQAVGGRELVFPGAMVSVKVGKGTLYIDQRRWMTAAESLAKVAQRDLCALAMGLGVTVAPAVNIRELPRNITYRPVDISAFANRALADETPDDGVGGWTDQGKTGDLRTFPTGTNTFAGVPFAVPSSQHKDPIDPSQAILEKSLIVLSCKDRPAADKLPTEVTIPLGQKLEGLCFMHGCAYSGAGTMVGLYQIQYADGSKVDIPLYSDLNIRDWIGTPTQLPREKGTSSAVAWTGSCKMFSTIGVYRMTWVNPRPEAPIKALRFAHPSRQGVPVLMAVTTIVAADQKVAAEAAEKARELLSKALQALQTNDLKTAKDLLQQALKTDSTLAAAHQALGDIAERSGDEKAALEVYRAWANAGADTPLPYNRIGQILEKQKDYKGALEAYTKSLKIEWNQPPTIEAKERVEALAK